MKIVAVTQRVDVFADRNEIRDSVDQNLMRFISESGFLPLPIPNILVNQIGLSEATYANALDRLINRIKPVGIVLSGGGDIGLSWERDSTEFQLLDVACKQQLPTLGICRGMQVMAAWAGSQSHTVQSHTATRHRIYGQISAEVNSFHSKSVKDCPDDFEVIARSSDHEIEAIRHKKLKWEGWMWHPEREPMFVKRDIDGLRKLMMT